MTKLSLTFSDAQTNQATDSNVCDFGQILEEFHEDFHRSDQMITPDEDAQLRVLYEEILNHYVLTAPQWTKLLGELVVGMYVDDLTAVAA